MLSRSPAHPTGFIEPCLPTPSRTVPDGSRWAFEVKHDGYRFIARRDGNRVRVFSRHGKDWSDKVPAIVDALRALPVTSATLDGEGVLCDDRGVTDFGRLRTALAGRGGSRSAFLFAFDLLELDGEDSPSPLGNPPRDADRPAAQGGPRRPSVRARRRRRRDDLPARVRARC